MLDIMQLRLDPWAAEYNTAYFADSIAPELHSQQIDITIEHSNWQACTPRLPAASAITWQRLLFSDGSRRIEARVLLEDADNAQLAFGALGSYALGVVDCCAQSQRTASYLDIEKELELHHVQRLCLLSNEHKINDFTIIPDSLYHFGSLNYHVTPCQGIEADAVIRELQKQMLKAERELTTMLLEHYDDALIIRDGRHPRRQEASRAYDVVGYVKTIHDIRLSRQELDVVRNLSEGQRSPLFLVQDPKVKHFVPYFECFLRLRDPSPWLYSLAGMVRLQFFAGKQSEKYSNYLAAAQARADWLSLHLPHFASRQYQDPRAPQQLLPVRALEAELRRRMGHPQLIRQRIMRYLRERNAG